MPTPSLYLQQGYSDQSVDPALRSRDMELLYVTDRAAQSDSDGVLTYGAERSASMAFGLARVRIGNEATDWPALVEQSNSAQRSKKLKLNVASIDELGRFPKTPYLFELTEQGMFLAPSVASELADQRDKFKQQIRNRLGQTQKKDVVLFVHGFNNSFDVAATTMASMWHFLERQAVPLVYSWPAAHGGLTGYFIDRESGEFTIYHLKETLRMLFAMTEVAQIHIIAHSRGTDITTTALRELVIENRARGGDPRRDFRISNLILAAPDLDFGVITQRLMAERFGPAIGQITIYTSEQDKALGISQLLMTGLRFGRVRADDIDVNERTIFQAVGNVSLIGVPKSGGVVGHGYFHDSPAVSSDIVRLIQDNALPGSEARPLVNVEGNFWRMDGDYLLQ